MKPQSKINAQLYIVAAAVLIYLGGLIFLKYNLNNLSLIEFRLDYIGNILNILIELVIVIGILKLSMGRSKIDGNKVVLLIGFQVISIIILILIYFVLKFNLIKGNGFILGFPARKVYTGFLFISGEFIQIYSMIYIWGIIFGSKELVLLKTLVRSVLTVVILIIFALLFVWDVKDFSEQKIADSKFNYGFVPGAAVYSRGKPSPIFEARLRKVFQLYQKGVVKKIILTGGNAPGEISESEAGHLYLKKLNVPDKNIIIENRSTTTSEQIKYLRAEIIDEKEVNSVVVTSDGFHLPRIIQISKFYKLNTIGIPSGYNLSFEKTIFYRARESVAVLLFWFFAI